jgi:cytoskeletal protein CcmA (bactofilin family)
MRAFAREGVIMADKEPCLIGGRITIRGQVSGNQDLVVEGRIEGRVALDNRFTVEESGVVEADLEVADAALKGEVRGDLVATRSAVLHPTARVVGNIRAPRLVIEEGARFSGSVDMDVELPAGVRNPSA